MNKLGDIILYLIAGLIALALLYQLEGIELFAIALVLFIALLTIPLYKQCLKKRRNPKSVSSLRRHWYEMKCQYIIIIFCIFVAFLMAEGSKKYGIVLFN